MTDLPKPPFEPQDDPESYVGLPVRVAEERARERGWNPVRALPPDAIITT